MPADRRAGRFSLFTLEHVTKRYQGVAALDDLTLQFDAGTVNAVIGTSGSGKSTLLRLLLALEWPDSGKVLVDGEVLTRESRQQLRHRVGYVIQDGGLFPHLRILDNLSLLPRHLKWHKDRIVTRARELLELMQLPPELLQRYPDELSGGQRQRVALMRALMTDPPALLMDEPLGALDPLVRFELQQRLQQLIGLLNKTVIVVTHDLAEAAFLAPRLVLMQGGRVVQAGSAQDLLQRPANDFVRRFVEAYRSAGRALDP